MYCIVINPISAVGHKQNTVHGKIDLFIVLDLKRRTHAPLCYTLPSHKSKNSEKLKGNNSIWGILG